jgi:D-glycero-D-manno-heptose 1,7-bisphosphate phosphatase
MNERLEAVVVVTNQRGVARGLMTSAAVDAVNERVNRLLAVDGGRIDAFFVCPHDYGDCACRKPAPGLLRAAAARFGLALADAVLIGDAETDIAAGYAVDAFTIRLAADGAKSQATCVVSGLSAAADVLFGQSIE